jgi:hypothetical protein
MTNFKTIGYVQLSASGNSFKVFVNSKFVGLVSVKDLQRCFKERFFVASIVQYCDAPATTLREADPEKLLKFSLNLLKENEVKE